MAPKRSRSNTSASQTSKNASATQTAASLPAVTEEVPIMPSKVEVAAVLEPEPVFEQYQDDLIDYDDDDLEAPVAEKIDETTPVAADDTTLIPAEPEAVEPEVLEPKETPEQAAAALEHGKAAMAWGTSASLAAQPGVITALGLTNIGASASTEVALNGTTYEVTWKVLAIEGVAAVPAIKCRFGKACNKGAACPFDHSGTVKTHPCTWVNTLQGCSKGTACEFSHETEGMKCTRSKYRSNCANGKACAYKHIDDTVKKPVQKVAKDGEANEAANEAKEDKHTPPPNAPKGPKLGKGAGQKRGPEGGDERRPAQRPRGNNDRGRACGRARGRGGRGRGGDFTVRGAAQQ